MIIYVLTNSVNNKQYVGKSKASVQRRFREHVRDARNGSSTAIHRAIRKYGADKFVVSQLDIAATKEELNEKERYWISTLKTLGEGYNMTPGGEGVGHKHSEKTKAKLRKAQKRYFRDHPEARRKAAEYGRMAKLSEAGRQKKREIMKGNSHSKGMTYQHTEEAKNAIGRAHTGKFVSEDTRIKISDAQKQLKVTRNQQGQFTSDLRPKLL